jgi:hypothetical protein
MSREDVFLRAYFQQPRSHQHFQPTADYADFADGFKMAIIRANPGLIRRQKSVGLVAAPTPVHPWRRMPEIG